VETVVLLLTDVQGSGRLWQEEPEAMDPAMARHHEIIHTAVTHHGGWRPVDQGEGDAVFAAFRSPTSAVACAADIQRLLTQEPWPTATPLRVRVGLHLGEVISRDGNLYGDPVNRCARLRGLGHGGQTLVSTALYEVVRDRLPAGTALVDLGEHRMKDLVRPERVWQLSVENLPQEFPALSSLDLAKHNLPVQPSALIGRELDLAEVLGLLRSERLVTLAGFGGMGKTRLALQAAAEVADGDGDGVWFVDLSSVTQAEQVPAEVARVLGIRETGEGPAAAVLQVLESKKLLLVLDNVEQVLECSAFVKAVLEAAPEVTILATSREPLRLRLERVLHLAPLSLPPAGEVEDVATLSTYAAVQLFVERAVAVLPAFAVDNDNAPAVAAICARLEGHPLAIELAAARVRLLSPGALLTRLDDALTLLTSRARDVPTRHQTLRATIAWSYDALPVDDRRLLDRLTVFASDFSLEAAEQICGSELDGEGDLDVLEGLTTLVDKSLVKCSAERYSLLVSIKEFASEHLDEGERRALAGRHAAYYQALVRPPDLTPERARVARSTSLREAAELRQALRHLQRHGTPEQVVAFPPLYFSALAALGHVEEVETTIESAVAGCATPAKGTVALLTALCGLYDTIGFLNRFYDAANRAVEAARTLDVDNDPDAKALLTEALTCRLIVDDDIEQVRRDADEAEALVATLPERGTTPPRWWLTFQLDSGISSAFRQDDPERSLAAALRIDPDHDDEGLAAGRVASRLCEMGRFADALPYVGGIRSGRDVADLLPLAAFWCLATAAVVRLGLGETDGAQELAQDAVELCTQHKLHGRISRPLTLLADIQRLRGDLGGAITLLDRASDESAKAEMPEQVAASFWRLARLHRLAGHSPETEEELAACVATLQHANGLVDQLGVRIEQAVREPDPVAAARLLREVADSRKMFPLPFGTQEDFDQRWTQLLELQRSDVLSVLLGDAVPAR